MASLSGQPADTSTAKVAMQLLKNSVGLKADVTNMVGYGAAPKVDASVCYDMGKDAAVGATAVFDLSKGKGALGKYTLAAQAKVLDDFTVAVSVADLETVKGSCVMAVDKTTAAALEVGTSRPATSSTSL